MKNGNAVLILKHPTHEGRIGYLVDFDKELEAWIVQVLGERIVVEEKNLRELED